MHAYLIVGDGEQAAAKCAKLVIQLKAKRFDFPLTKIDDTRSLNKFTSMVISAPTAIVIENIDNASTEALNAFLKSLEEAQDNLFFILTASSVYKVIPTITSRCQIIKLVPDKLGSKLEGEAADFLSATLKSKLLRVDKIKSRDEAVDFIEKLTINGHVLLHQTKEKKAAANLLSLAQNTLNALNANGNYGLHLINFALKSEAK